MTLLAGVSFADRTRSRMGLACGRLLEALGAEPARSSSAEIEVLDAPGRRGGRSSVSVRLGGHEGPSPAYGREAAAELAGAHAALAAIAAFRHARLHDRRVDVVVDQNEVVASCLGEHLIRRICPRGGGGAPRDTRPRVVRCADGHAGVAAPTEEDAAALRTLAGADPSSPAFQAYTASLTRDELVDVAQLWRVPVVPALSPDEAIGRRELLGAPDGASPFLIAPANGRARSRRRRGPLPLSGLRVLDLGMVWAGPWCGRLLAGLGANVVKIEGPARSDGTRAAGSGCSGAFADLNRGKRSLVLDLGREEGRAAFLRLARSADALIENFSPRVMPNFGLGHDRLAAETGLLTLALPAFPSRGPWSSYVAYGGGVELAAGLAPMGAHAAPEPAPVPYLDYLSGSYGAAAVVAAIVARDRSGATARIELAQWALAECLLRANGSRPLSPADACDVDALLARPALAGGGLVDRDGAEDGPCSHYRRLPFAISGVRTRRELPAPAFGADSRRVLAGWARVGPEQLAALVAGGIVREADAG